MNITRRDWLERVLLATMLSIAAADHRVPYLSVVTARAAGEQVATPATVSKETIFTDIEHSINEMLEQARVGEAFDEAERLLTLARQSGKPNRQLASALATKAMTLMARNQHKSARNLFEEALAVLRQLDQADPNVQQDVARILVNLGVVDQLDGQLVNAEKSVKSALEIQERLLPSDHIDIATTLIGLAKVSQGRRDFESEQRFWTRALEIRRRTYKAGHYNIAVALEGLAGALEAQLRTTEAEPLLREALEYRVGSHHPNHPHVAAVHQRLANNLRRQGKSRHAEAELLHRKALEIRSRSDAFPGDHARNKIDLAQLLLEMRRFDDSRKLLEQAIADMRKIVHENHEWLAQGYIQLALSQSLLGDPNAALDSSRMASVILTARPPRNARLARFQFESHMTYAWQARGRRARGASAPLADETFALAQRASVTRAAASAAQMASRLATRDQQLRSVVREQQDLTQAVDLAERALTSALATNASLQEVEAYRSSIKTAAMDLEQIEQRLRRDFPQLEALVRPAPMSISEVRGRLASDEVLLFVFAGFDNVYVWAVTRESESWVKPKLTAPELDLIVKRLRSGLVFGPEDDDPGGALARQPLYDLGLAHSLYSRLFGEVDTLIAGKRHILYVPTGSLSSLPIHVLVRTKPAIPQPSRQQPAAYKEAGWVIRTHEISVLPDVATLRNLSRQDLADSARRPLIAFADPIYDTEATNEPEATRSGARGSDRSGRRTLPALAGGSNTSGFELLKRLDRLQGTRNEVEAVAQTVGAAEEDLFFDRWATETNVRRLDREGRLTGYKVLYFATHGIVADAAIDQLKIGNKEPALVLTLPAKPSDEDDGLLSSSEIAQLRLDADWVVLSACDTAAGQSTDAETLSGLARAFFYAGARSIVVTHWGASDLDAKELMTRTFGEIRSTGGLRKSEAIRRAMMSRISGATRSWDAYPSYWGPFTLIVAAR